MFFFFDETLLQSIITGIIRYMADDAYKFIKCPTFVTQYNLKFKVGSF